MDLVRSLGRVEANLDLRSNQRANSSTRHRERGSTRCACAFSGRCGCAPDTVAACSTRARCEAAADPHWASKFGELGFSR